MKTLALPAVMAKTIVDGLYPAALHEPGEIAIFLRRRGYSPTDVADNLVAAIRVAGEMFDTIRQDHDQAQEDARAAFRANGGVLL